MIENTSITQNDCLPVTWKRAFIVWWAFAWRYLMFMVPVWFILLSTYYVNMDRYNSALWVSAIPVVTIPFSIAWLINIIKKTLYKKIGNFRIVLLPASIPFSQYDKPEHLLMSQYALNQAQNETPVTSQNETPAS